MPAYLTPHVRLALYDFASRSGVALTWRQRADARNCMTLVC